MTPLHVASVLYIFDGFRQLALYVKMALQIVALRSFTQQKKKNCDKQLAVRLLLFL